SPGGEGAIELRVIFSRIDEVGVVDRQLDQGSAKLLCQLRPAVVLMHDGMWVAAEWIAFLRAEHRDRARPADFIERTWKNILVWQSGRPQGSKIDRIT